MKFVSMGEIFACLKMKSLKVNEKKPSLQRCFTVGCLQKYMHLRHLIGDSRQNISKMKKLNVFIWEFQYQSTRNYLAHVTVELQMSKLVLFKK